MASDLDLDALIQKLTSVQGPASGSNLSEGEVTKLCMMAKSIFLSGPTLLELQAPIKICGDIHGQLTDLNRIFSMSGFPPNVQFLFLGDMVDRGNKSVETISLLFALKCRHPDSFHLVRGNHEDANENRGGGFFTECRAKFGNDKVWSCFNHTFNCMPLAAVISERIFACHGGLSPRLKWLQQIRDIQRPSIVVTSGLFCDLVWSDPDPTLNGWESNSGRAVSIYYGPDMVGEFLQRNDLDLMIRAHECVDAGYEFFAGGRLCTIFSAPNYLNNNAGAVLVVDDALECSFEILQGQNGTAGSNSGDTVSGQPQHQPADGPGSSHNQ